MADLLTAEFWTKYGPLLLDGTVDTLVMTGISTVFAYLLGLPLGVALILTQPHGIRPNNVIYKVLGWIINVGRSLPFIILMIAIMDFTKLIVGTKIGVKGAIVPLVVSAAPFIARMVETSLMEVDAGVIEAAKSMGASTFQIIWKVLLPEAKPSLLIGAAISTTTILGYSAMAGVIGGGGLGDIAIRYGYYRYDTGVMLVTLVFIVAIVQLLQGLGNTLIITFFAIILSVILGTVIAIVRARHERRGGWRIPNMLCQLYLTIMRGTPTMVQLLIIYYVVFASADVNKILVAVIAFGLNSAAYIAEVIRSGIMSVDEGQMEAGRSLGLSYGKTMRLIILPQAFKNVLPAMGNELITLLKETSISGYIGLGDLTKGSDIIRSITYEAMMPLGVVACLYLILVLGLNAGVRKLEKRLRKSER